MNTWSSVILSFGQCKQKYKQYEHHLFMKAQNFWFDPDMQIYVVCVCELD